MSSSCRPCDPGRRVILLPSESSLLVLGVCSVVLESISFRISRRGGFQFDNNDNEIDNNNDNDKNRKKLYY